MNSKQDDEEIRRQTKQHSLHGPTERRDQAEAPSVSGKAPKKGDDDDEDDGATEADKKRLKELSHKRDSGHALSAHETKELEDLEAKEKHGKKHDDFLTPEDTRRIAELKRFRENRPLTELEEKELATLEKKKFKLVPKETPEEKKIAPDVRLGLLRRARDLIALYVTSRRGSGSPLGEIGEPMFAWLQEIDLLTTPTQLPADDSDLDDLPKDERDAIIKERKAERKRLADLEKKDAAVAKEEGDDAEKEPKDPKKVPVF